MKARLLAIAKGRRDDWRRTNEATKVVLIVIAALILAWVAFPGSRRYFPGRRLSLTDHIRRCPLAR